MAPHLGYMTANSQRTYIGRANLAIREYIRWKTTGIFAFIQNKSQSKPTKPGKLDSLLNRIKGKG